MPGGVQPLGVDDRMARGRDQLGREADLPEVVADELGGTPGVGVVVRLGADAGDAEQGLELLLEVAHDGPPGRHPPGRLPWSVIPRQREKGGTCPHGRGGEPNRKPISIARRLVPGDMRRADRRGSGRSGGGRARRGCGPAGPSSIRRGAEGRVGREAGIEPGGGEGLAGGTAQPPSRVGMIRFIDRTPRSCRESADAARSTAM